MRVRCSLGRATQFGEYGQAGRRGRQRAGVFEGICCQCFLPHSGAWEGKHRVDLKDFKRGPLPAKNRLHLSLCLCPSSSPHSAAPPSISRAISMPSVHPRPQTFLLHSVLDATAPTLASHSVLASARCRNPRHCYS